MDEELRTAVGNAIASLPALTSLLKRGRDSIFYGRSPEIVPLAEVPYVRFFAVHVQGNSDFIQPDQYLQIRLQVDAVAEDEATQNAIAGLFPEALSVPARRSPIETAKWRIDCCFFVSAQEQSFGSDIEGGGKKITCKMTDWSLRAKGE